jgi:penicillin amidase
MNRYRLFLATLFLLIVPYAAQAGISLPGLEATVTVERDSNGIPHIYAENEHDLFFMQGRIHAEDRLFQMDLLRRSAAGTLAELFGASVLQTDVETRTIGLSRAAVRSLAAHPQEMIDILQAYSDGVNSFLDEAEADPLSRLPLEYLGLGLFTVKRWQPLDSVLVGKALAAGTSLIVTDDIDLSIALGTYQAVGPDGGFDGTALFFEDLFRSAPFDPAATVPDAMEAVKHPGGKPKGSAATKKLKPPKKDAALKHGRDYRKRIHKLPRIPGTMSLRGGDMGGSNSWVISGKHTRDHRPLLANDIHQRLDSPVLFHEIHLDAPGFKVTGSSLPGAPCVVRGHNPSITWGITNSRLDITDIFSEQIVPLSATQLSTRHIDAAGNESLEPIQVVIEAFSANMGGVVVPVHQQPVYIVPRRNNGPLITPPAIDAATGMLTALSVQSVGFGPTRDPEGLCEVNRARNLGQFKKALQLVDFASQNFTYADKKGNIGYFVSGEVPLREDLQNPAPGITPPFLIRNGVSGNEWIPLGGDLPKNQATPFEILPAGEMPRVINPPSGIIVNANNDQLGNTLDNNPLNDLREDGKGLLYLNWGGRNFSIRAGRATEMINPLLSKGGRHSKRHHKISFKEMKAMQADTVLNDARALVPYILQAYENAGSSGAHPGLAFTASDPRLGEAVERLRNWDFTTPTGIPHGCDANPGKADAGASVAATIYSTWRGAMVANSIDATLDFIGGLAGIEKFPRPVNREEVITALKHLLEKDGVSDSGLNFFNPPFAADPATRRDTIVLASLSGALDLLAADAFAPAFANSTNQDDYRWGRLHRIVLKHPLGNVDGRFNTPPAFGMFPAPLDGLDGIPVDGGFETVDAATPLDVNNIRVKDSDSFMFDFGATGRYVASPGRHHIKAETSLPGGESSVPGSPFYVNLLEPYLNNETFPLPHSSKPGKKNVFSTQEFVPGS